ncbi:MAG: LamG-like jellyroll fold domain-containing protein, partial [Planctomycetota bacterium]
EPNYTVPATLQLNTTYYWRVDEVNTGDGTVYDTYPGDRVWQFTTEDGNARDPMPDDLRGYNPTDAVLTWTPSCIATGQTVYLSTDFSDVNTMQPGAIEDDTLSGTDNNCPVGTLDTYTTYYWRVKTDSGGNGEVWTFKTGYGGLILEMLFEGSLGADLPATELDTSGNDLHFTTFSAAHDPCADGSAKYAGGRFDGTSVDLDPCAGLYRLDPCGPNDPPDMLRLDGHQYTIELWFKPETLTDAHGDIMLIGKSDGPWAIRINNPGDEDVLELIHNGDAAGDDDWALQAGEWHHIAAVYDQLAGFDYKVRLYYNGVLLETDDGGPNPSDNNEPVGIGMEIRADGTADGYFDGLIDQVRIWDIVVEPVLECASEPHPADVRVVLTDAGPKRWDACDPDLDTFTWKPGAYAASVDGHNIYFGDSIDDVNESADPCVTGHDSNSWTHGMTLEAGKTYYWRVDEVNNLDVWTGLIWIFQTQAELIDPNIVVYYPLDETSGRDVFDHSGRYFDAECDDDPHWEPNNGRFGGCMHFSMEYDAGDDDWDNEEPGNIETKSNYGAGMANLINKEISICVWVNGEPNQRSDDDMVVFEFCDDDYDDEDGYKEEADNTKILAVVPTEPTERGNVVFRAGLYPEDTMTWTEFDPLAARGTWQHFVFIKNENDANMYIYLNTELVATKKGCSTTSLADVRGDGGDATLKLGAWVGAGSQYHGRLDEFQIYNKALDEQEIEKIFRGGELEPAWSPSPYDG